jgi:hypothetical protein
MPGYMMGEKDFVLWSLLDDRIIWTADKLRERYGRAYINNWPFGGKNQYRGFRPFDSEVGAKFSQHKFGRAIDITFDAVSADEVRADMKSAGKTGTYKYITACELNTSWLHVDCRFTDMEEIFFFNP